MRAATQAGIAYFGIVFAAGFVLGTPRVLLFAPRFGELAGVAIELPVMLALSWLVCRRLIALVSVPGEIAARLLMGGLAFALLMIAEYAVAAIGFGRTPAQHLAVYRESPALLGLLAQIGFALIPALQIAPGPRRAS